MEDFQGSETALYEAIMMDISLYTFLQPHKIYSSRRDSSWLCWAVAAALELLWLNTGLGSTG